MREREGELKKNYKTNFKLHPLSDHQLEYSLIMSSKQTKQTNLPPINLIFKFYNNSQWLLYGYTSKHNLEFKAKSEDLMSL